MVVVKFSTLMSFGHLERMNKDEMTKIYKIRIDAVGDSYKIVGQNVWKI